MQHDERRAAIGAYKERKVEAGIYAIRCAASGEVWVGRAPDLTTIQNRHWFTLKMGSHTHAALQRAWNSHGADYFSFEIVQRLTDKEREENNEALRTRLLQKYLLHWADQLQATRI